jgi:hypothetical protein
MPELARWVMVAVAGASALWVAGAIHFDVCSARRYGRWFALAWLFAVAALFVTLQTGTAFLVYLGVSIPFTVWWLFQKPSHDRAWEPGVAVLPRAVVNGDEIVIENLRNFDYPAPGEFNPRYETRTVRLTNLTAIDIIFFNWGMKWMSHPVLVFDFGPDGRVCISVEVRYRRGQDFALVRSLYRQQELIFVVADERDIILRRTRTEKPQEALLYRMTVPPDEARVSFLDYMNAVNDLFARPRWYNGLCMNCTTTFYRLPNSKVRLDWRVLANGLLDRALYDDGRLDRSLPFEQLRTNAYITVLSNAAPEAGFGDYIRNELEGRRNG